MMIDKWPGPHVDYSRHPRVREMVERFAKVHDARESIELNWIDAMLIAMDLELMVILDNQRMQHIRRLLEK